MYERILKQSLYAGGCFSIVFIILLFFAIIAARPSLPSITLPDSTPEFDDIVVEGDITVIPHGTSVDLVARVRNPNAGTGIEEISADFVLYNPEGAEFTRRTATGYLLPGAFTYLHVLDVRLTDGLGRVELELPTEQDWQAIPVSAPRVTLNTFERSRGSKLIGASTVEEVKGTVKNDSAVAWQKVEVASVAIGNDGQVIGIGTTFIGELGAGEQREFTVQWPLPNTETARVISTASTNIFQEENIVSPAGDPSTLR